MWSELARLAVVPLLGQVVLEAVGAGRAVRFLVITAALVVSWLCFVVPTAELGYWMFTLALLVWLSASLLSRGWRSSVRGSVLVAATGLLICAIVLEVSLVDIVPILVIIVNLPLILIPVALLLYQWPGIGPSPVEGGSRVANASQAQTRQARSGPSVRWSVLRRKAHVRRGVGE